MLIGPVTALFAHGSMKFPPSRSYQCSHGHDSSLACQEAYKLHAEGNHINWTWAEVNTGGPTNSLDVLKKAIGDHSSVVPAGKLCSAGQARFTGLDQNTELWQSLSTQVDSGATYTFDWDNSWAPHTIAYIDYYITKENADLSKPLNWGMLQKFCSQDETNTSQANDPGKYQTSCTLPQRADGSYAVVYGVWHRLSAGNVPKDSLINSPITLTEENKLRLQKVVDSGTWDSDETFYACSDVQFGHGSPIDPPKNNWQTLGELSVANGEYPVGTQVSFDLYQGAQLVKQEAMQLTTATNNYSLALAQHINAGQFNPEVKIGQLHDGKVVYQSQGINHIYIDSDKAKDFHYTIAHKLPEAPIQPEWHAVSGSGVQLSDNPSLKVGDKITFRLQNAGQDYINKTITVDMAIANDWTYQLANSVNAEALTHHAEFKVGVLQKDGEVIPQPNSSNNKVYVFTNNVDQMVYRINIEAKQPETNNTCSYDFNILSEWGTGYQAGLSITNTGNTPMNSWTISFPVNSAVVSLDGWNGKFTLENDQVTITNESWNAGVSADGGVISGLGFVANLSHSIEKERLQPISLKVNGVTCELSH